MHIYSSEEIHSETAHQQVTGEELIARVDFYITLGYQKERSGDFESAIILYQIARHANPLDTRPIVCLHNALLDLKRQKIEDREGKAEIRQIEKSIAGLQEISGMFNSSYYH